MEGGRLPYRHCERSEAIQDTRICDGGIDCFASLAMTWLAVGARKRFETVWRTILKVFFSLVLGQKTKDLRPETMGLRCGLVLALRLSLV